MAQYIGYLKGKGQTLSRTGHKSSGVHVEARGWDCGASVYVSWDTVHQCDVVTVMLNSGSRGTAGNIVLYHGTESQILAQLRERNKIDQ